MINFSCYRKSSWRQPQKWYCLNWLTLYCACLLTCSRQGAALAWPQGLLLSIIVEMQKYGAMRTKGKAWTQIWQLQLSMCQTTRSCWGCVGLTGNCIAAKKRVLMSTAFHTLHQLRTLTPLLRNFICSVCSRQLAFVFVTAVIVLHILNISYLHIYRDCSWWRCFVLLYNLLCEFAGGGLEAGAVWDMHIDRALNNPVK